VKPVVQKVEVDLNDTSIGAQLIRAMSDLDDLILKGEKTKNTFDEINSSPE
jgi:hypothetical protein